MSFQFTHLLVNQCNIGFLKPDMNGRINSLNAANGKAMVCLYAALFLFIVMMFSYFK